MSYWQTRDVTAYGTLTDSWRTGFMSHWQIRNVTALCTLTDSWRHSFMPHWQIRDVTDLCHTDRFMTSQLYVHWQIRDITALCHTNRFMTSQLYVILTDSWARIQQENLPTTFACVLSIRPQSSIWMPPPDGILRRNIASILLLSQRERNLVRHEHTWLPFYRPLMLAPRALQNEAYSACLLNSLL